MSPTKRKTAAKESRKASASAKRGKRAAAPKRSKTRTATRNKRPKTMSAVAPKRTASRMQRVAKVAMAVAQQAQSAVSEGVDVLREAGGELVDRVTGA